MNFMQSGDLPARVVEAKLREAPTPYEKHLWVQPLLMDFMPRFEAVEDWHIANYRAALENWLAEEKRLRAIWRASPSDIEGQ